MSTLQEATNRRAADGTPKKKAKRFMGKTKRESFAIPLTNFYRYFQGVRIVWVFHSVSMYFHWVDQMEHGQKTISMNTSLTRFSNGPKYQHK